MKKLGNNLTSLSLDNGLHSKCNDQRTPEDLITKICGSCPNLERLGYRMTEDDMHSIKSQFHVDQHHVFVCQASILHPNWVQSTYTS